MCFFPWHGWSASLLSIGNSFHFFINHNWSNIRNKLVKVQVALDVNQHRGVPTQENQIIKLFDYLEPYYILDKKIFPPSHACLLLASSLSSPIFRADLIT